MDNPFVVAIALACCIFVFWQLRKNSKKVKGKKPEHIEKVTDFFDQQCVGQNLIFTEASIFSFGTFATKTFKYVAVKKENEASFIFFNPLVLSLHSEGVYVYMKENSLDKIFVYGAGYLDIEKVESALKVSFYGVSFGFFTPQHAFLISLKEKLEDEAKRKDQQLKIFIDGEKRLPGETRFYSIEEVIGLLLKK